MSFSNIDQLALGNLLQIAFSNGVRNQISQDFRDFEMIKRARVNSSVARELRFMLQLGYGPGAIAYRNPGTSGRSFPTAQSASVAEYTAKFKEINGTIELDYSLFDRVRKSPEKYADYLAIEIDSKASAAKRRIAADLYGDGTGVMGTIASASGSTTQTVTLSTANTARGHVGFFEFQDLLVHYAANGGAGSTVTVSSGTFSHWRVLSKDRENAQVVLQAVNTAGADVDATSWTPVAGEVFYRLGQSEISDIPNLGSISDYGTVTTVMPGLETLAAADGRSVFGIAMSGVTAGSRIDAGANAIDVKYIQKVMDKAKVAVGQDRYRWKMMSMAPETQAALIESREADRRFMTVDDNKRGVKFFAYVHGNDTLECYTSEYTPPKRIYVLPETKAGEKVIEYHGTDFESVKGPGKEDWFLKPGSSGGFVNVMTSFLQSYGIIIAKHPAAIAVVENFTNS